MGLGPPLGEAFGSGKSGAICAHCSSVNSHVWRAIGGLLGQRQYKNKKKIEPLSSYETASKFFYSVMEEVIEISGM